MRASSNNTSWLTVTLILLGFAGCQPASQETQVTPAPTPTSVPSPPPDEAAAAADTVRSYYRAIGERRYRDAYQLWARDGSASGKSFEEFRSGFSETESVEVSVGTPGPMEGAAGSRYIDVPVRVSARLRSGMAQEFSGTYTMRRSVVDGATPAQLAWHIESAKLRQEK
jgi:hypothetical protein